MSLRYCSHLFNFLQMSHNSFSPNSFTQPREAIWCIGCVPVCAKSFPLFDSATPLTIALQGPLSSRFSRQEYWSGLPFPPSGIKPEFLVSPALAGRFFTTAPPRKPLKCFAETPREIGLFPHRSLVSLLGPAINLPLPQTLTFCYCSTTPYVRHVNLHLVTVEFLWTLPYVV